MALKIKMKKLSSKAVMPTYAKEGDACMDLTATMKVYDNDGNIVYYTGVAFEIPKGYVGLIFPRSSNAKKELLLANSVGVIDSGYRGEVFIKFKTTASINFLSDKNIEYEVGDKVCQIMILPYPNIEFEMVDELSDTDRGDGGFGSTGK